MFWVCCWQGFTRDETTCLMLMDDGLHPVPSRANIMSGIRWVRERGGNAPQWERASHSFLFSSASGHVPDVVLRGLMEQVDDHVA